MSRCSMLLGCCMMVVSLPSVAQTPPAPPAPQAAAAGQPGTMVFSQNKCPQQNVSQARALIDSTFAPVLDELVQEKKLAGWGMLGHAWGDEWNLVIYYTAASHRAFVDAWEQAIARTNQRFPGAFARLTPLCSEHKDNIYSVMRMTGR